MKFCPVCGTEYADEIRFCQRDGQTLRASNPGGDLVGQVIADRYHITKKLGEGGMGAVYLAEHVKMGRQSAIKVMGTGMSHDPEAISRFNREAANASRINHPNVCAVYDFGETEDGTIYLAMEFVEGGTLSSLLKETGPLPLPRAVGLLQQCADGLQAAHDLGIVHRDLKPDNIMIVSPKGREVVKVVDFGIAKAGAGEPGQKVTKTGLVVGTPEYMSPEQLSGDKVDGRSDIYSLALVFYRMITDTLPFIADTAQETMIKRLTDEPIPLAQARPDASLSFPPALQKVMDRALARWPQDRYASATEFAADAAAPSKASRRRRWPPRRTPRPRPRWSARPILAGAKTAAIPATRVSSPKTRIESESGGGGRRRSGAGAGRRRVRHAGHAVWKRRRRSPPNWILRQARSDARGTRVAHAVSQQGAVESYLLPTPDLRSHRSFSPNGVDRIRRGIRDNQTPAGIPPHRIQPESEHIPQRPQPAELQRQVTAFIDDIEFTDDAAQAPGSFPAGARRSRQRATSPRSSGPRQRSSWVRC